MQMQGSECNSRLQPKVTHQNAVCLKKLVNRGYNPNLIGSMSNYEKVVGHDMKQLYRMYEETISILSRIFIGSIVNEAQMSGTETINDGKKKLNKKANKQLLHMMDEFPDRHFLDVEQAKCSKKYKDKQPIRPNEVANKECGERVSSMGKSRKVFEIVVDNDKTKVKATSKWK